MSIVFAAEPTSITLEEAIRLAGAQAPSVLVANAQMDAAQAQFHQAWTARLPSLSLSGNVLLYDDEQSFSLISTSEPLDCTPFEALGLTELCEGFGAETVVREQVTSSLMARVTLPLTGQIAIDRSVAAARSSRDASESSGEAALLNARWQAEDAWFTALLVERQLSIARGQVRSLEQRILSANAAHQAGALTRNELLLAELGLAQARQMVLQLEAACDSSYGALGMATGSGLEPLRPAEPPDAPPRPPPDAQRLAERAVASHPDLQALRSTRDAAYAAAQAASWGRLPSVVALAAWQHSEGQGVFADPDTLYMGAQLDWTVWAWGRDTAGVKAARAGVAGLEAQLQQAEAGVRLNVLAHARTLAAARAAYDIASASIEAAEENLRIQEVRQSSGSGTMQELLDAELSLLQARSNQASALFEGLRSEAALERAAGSDPWAP